MIDVGGTIALLIDMCTNFVFKRLAFVLLFLTFPLFAQAEAVDAALAAYPTLSRLYNAYPTQRQTFTDYANRQGFRLPIENLATVVHELVHVASAAHQGYFVEGTYYEPYLRSDAWPSLSNAQVAPLMLDQERTVIFQFYVQNAPKNTLANVVDEINAYGHVLPMVCRYEPESSSKQMNNLLGFLHLQEAYLRTLRRSQPHEYQALIGNKASRGVLTLVTRRAWKGLQECGMSAGMIPATEVQALLGQ